MLRQRPAFSLLPLVRQRGSSNSNSNNNNNNGELSSKTTTLTIDDADAAAGKLLPYHNINNINSPLLQVEPAPSSINTVTTLNTINSNKGHPMDLEFFEDLVSEPVLVLGVDITHLPRPTQFVVCATGVFLFSLLYGYLQELIAVNLCNRHLGLFQAVVQFTGYTVLAFFLRNFVYEKNQRIIRKRRQRSSRHPPYGRTNNNTASSNTNGLPRRVESNMSLSTSRSGSFSSMDGAAAAATVPLLAVPPPPTNVSIGTVSSFESNSGGGGGGGISNSVPQQKKLESVPVWLYLGLSLLRAVDLAMTNLAMQYINYPAKTLMKSSRVVFTMLFGVVISRKKYFAVDYLIVTAMVAGLCLFMHADASSSAVFHHSGVIMLTVSLVCDGAISNVSETIMNRFGVGQDEFIFRMYSIALVAITAAAAAKGDLREGILWLLEPGTFDEFKQGVPFENRTWSVSAKLLVMLLFSSMGFFGSSCSAAITKNFGALSMSITSTARKATTLFLSFFLFNNVCTPEHVSGIAVFIAALTAKSLRRGRSHSKTKTKKPKRKDTMSSAHDHDDHNNLLVVVTDPQETIPTKTNLLADNNQTAPRQRRTAARGVDVESGEASSRIAALSSPSPQRLVLRPPLVDRGAPAAAARRVNSRDGSVVSVGGGGANNNNNNNNNNLYNSANLVHIV